jgi:two-component system sensor histidine kinase SenX3
MSRSARRRLATALDRIERHGVLDAHVDEGDPIARLEEAVARCVTRVADADARVDRLAAALDEVVQGVVVCDEQGTVVYRNRPALAFAGARHGEALAERAVAELLAAAVAGEPQTETLELFGPPRRTLTITATPLDDGSRTVGAVAVVDDITERRRLEAIRRDFVANISHELKTPVGALSLVAEALEGEDDPDLVRRLSQRMQKEAMRLSDIIDDLLELSRIEDDSEPQGEPIAVHLVVSQAMDRVRSLADHRGIEVEAGDPASGPVVLGDRRQLVSAVHNLLENAVKYSDDGSTVHMRVARDGGWVSIAVIDHGIGIPSRDLDRIFERFYRVDRARARDTGGTGLGLAIVRHVADNHGGRVEVQSREGEGSTFTLWLPVGHGAPVCGKEANG